MTRNTESIKETNWRIVGFTLLIMIPSTALFQRFLGLAGVFLYIAVVSLILILINKYRHPIYEFAAKISHKQAFWLTVITFLIIIILFFIIYPIANSGALSGGSDSDDALNIATREILHGRYPYYPKTYLGNPISPLPGALILAVPFVLLGNGAYQNIFWLVLFVIGLRSYLKDGRLALLVLWGILALFPTVLYGIVTGSDYIANSIYVLLFTIWLVRAVAQPGLKTWGKILPAIFLGIGLSSRANFLLILPVVFFTLWILVGWKTAIKYATVVLGSFIVVTIPFYIYDPQSFSPLHTANELSRFEAIIPFAAIAIPFITGVTALLLGFQQLRTRNPNNVLRNSTIVLAFPILCAIILDSTIIGSVNFRYAVFGTLYFFFGVATVLSYLGRNSGRQPDGSDTIA